MNGSLHRLRLVLGVAGLLPLGACASGGGASPRAPAAQAPAPTPPAQAPVTADETDQLLGATDRDLALWDAAQTEGRLAEADALAARLRAATDTHFEAFVGAARGQRGQSGTYVGTMALGFSPRPEATAVLVERLADRDPRLVANALLALRLRADPATPLAPLVAHLASGQADVRRYAPLAFARTLEARRRAGQSPDAAAETQALRRLSVTTRDQDPLVRLHTVRALGELSLPEAQDLLLGMLDDTSKRVALGAAAGLSRSGGRVGFERSVQLLNNSPDEAKPLVAGVLVMYAERLQGAPLSPQEIQYLGASAPAWARWYAEFVKRVPAPARRT